MVVTREEATRQRELPGGSVPAEPSDRESRYLLAVERARDEFLAQGGFEAPLVSPDHRFDTFVPGTTGNVALQACLAVCDHPGSLYNPLFIHGKPGVGKTHLLDSIYHSLSASRPRLLVLRTSGEGFGDELLAALAHRWFERFRLKYRHADALLLDSINLKRGQEEFQALLDHLVGQGRQVVITSPVPVHQLEGASEALRSRLSSGLVVEVDLPDLGMRRTLIARAAARHGLDLPRDVAFSMARRLPTDARSLEGAVQRLVAWHAVHPRPWEKMGLDILCHDLPLEELGTEITLDEIIEKVSAHFGLEGGVPLPGRHASRPRGGPRAQDRHVLVPHAHPALPGEGGPGLPRHGRTGALRGERPAGPRGRSGPLQGPADDPQVPGALGSSATPR